jgi:mannose PTS system EIIA component
VNAVLLIAHVPLASALRQVALHAFPDEARHIAALDVEAGMPLDQIETLAQQHLDRLAGQQVLVLVDVFGATPCNVALRLADGSRARVLTGVNVPMLWRALTYRCEPLESMALRASAGGTQGVMSLSSHRPQNQSTRPLSPDDQDAHHHQQ